MPLSPQQLGEAFPLKALLCFSKFEEPAHNKISATEETNQCFSSIHVRS